MKAFWVADKCVIEEFGDALVWAENASKAKYIAVQGYMDAGYARTKMYAFKMMRVRRAPEYDEKCPDPNKRQAWCREHVEEVARHGQC